MHGVLTKGMLRRPRNRVLGKIRRPPASVRPASHGNFSASIARSPHSTSRSATLPQPPSCERYRKHRNAFESKMTKNGVTTGETDVTQHIPLQESANLSMSQELRHSPATQPVRTSPALPSRWPEVHSQLETVLRRKVHALPSAQFKRSRKRKLGRFVGAEVRAPTPKNSGCSLLHYPLSADPTPGCRTAARWSTVRPPKIVSSVPMPHLQRARTCLPPIRRRPRNPDVHQRSSRYATHAEVVSTILGPALDRPCPKVWVTSFSGSQKQL